jgi:hypothetical protein
MAFVQLLEFHGGTLQEWQAIHKEVAPDGILAPGALFHVAGPTEDGWRVVNVWESDEAFQTFFRERLLPIIQKAGVQPPQATVWPVDNMMK